MSARDIATFFERLTSIERIARLAVGDARLSVLLVLRGEPAVRVLLDFTRTPLRVDVVPRDVPAALVVAVEAELLHRILLGEVSPGLALGQRRLLLRGSAADVALLAPLFDVAPLLYREHLSLRANRGDPMDFQGDPIETRRLGAAQKAAHAAVERMAYALGFGLSAVRRRLLAHMSLFDVLRAMARGMEDEQRREG